MEKSRFTTSNQASGRSYVVNGQDPCIEQINDRRVIAVSRVAPGLAQWIALIYHQKDLSRPSRRSTWRTIGLHRLLALRDFEERGPASSQPRDAKCRKHSGLGPTVSRSVFSRPSRGDTWQQVEPSRRFAHRDSKAQKEAPLCYDARDAGKVPDPGPRQRQVSSRPSDLKGTRGNRLSRLGISLIAISISKDQPLHIRERRKHHGNRHVVTVHGHLEKERSCSKEGRSAEFSYREDRRGLQAPSDPISILFLV
jgi:hypothetical protein